MTQIYQRRTFPIIDKLGGRRIVLARLREKGIRLESVDQFRQWASRHRGLIPNRGKHTAMLALMELADEQGVRYTADDFKVRITYSNVSDGGEADA